MTVLITCAWSTYEKGKEYDVDDETGNLLIGTGCASVVELSKPKKREAKGLMLADKGKKEE